MIERAWSASGTPSRRVLLTLGAPASLLAASLAVAVASSSPPPSGAHVAPAIRAQAHLGTGSTRGRGSGLPSRPPAAPTSPVATPRAVGLRFAQGWLDCTDHQAPCSWIGGMLPAYAAALGRQQGRSLATPAELAARPRVLSLQLLRSCPRSAVAAVTYTDGTGGRFQIHVNLVRDRTGWSAFDVAEAPPHIPLPPPLGRGPRGC